MPGHSDAVVRDIEANDCARLLEMVQGLATHHGDVPQTSLEALRRDVLGTPPWLHVLVAEVDGAVVGYAALCPLAQMQMGVRGMDIHHLFVEHGFRGRGVGQRLIAASMVKARALGCAFLMVGTHPDNHTAQGFYLSQGFEQRYGVSPRFRIGL